ncbi:MAG: type III pantothenate kinase [Firmicutes bacterium]|nr:type III pantothenate kinase [Bacillota bacterium]
MYRRRRTPCRHRCGAPACGQRHSSRPLFHLTGSDPHCVGRRPVRLGLEALLSGTAQLPDIRLRIPDRVICGRTEESLLSGALYRAAAMTEGLAQRMEQELGCPCTHWCSPAVWAASWRPCAAGRPSTTRICCCVACGSAAPLTAHRQISPEKRSRYKRRLGTTSPQPPFVCPTTGRVGLTERTPAPPMRRR